MPWTRYRCDTTSATETTKPRRENTRDDEMLKELDVLEPKGIRETIDMKLVETIIGAKRKLGWGIIEWSYELADGLHKPVRKKFKNRRVLVSGTDAIWTADLVDMQRVSRSNKGFKYILMIIDVFSSFVYCSIKCDDEIDKLCILFNEI